MRRHRITRGSGDRQLQALLAHGVTARRLQEASCREVVVSCHETAVDTTEWRAKWGTWPRRAAAREQRTVSDGALPRRISTARVLRNRRSGSTPMMPEFSSAGTEWSRTKSDPVQPPTSRRLRGYAFDPSLSVQLETALVN